MWWLWICNRRNFNVYVHDSSLLELLADWLSQCCCKPINCSRETECICSVWDLIYALRKAHMRCAPLRLWFFPPSVAFETDPVLVWLHGDRPFPSFQGRSSSPSCVFHASLLQPIHGVTSLGLCQKVVSEATQHFACSEKKFKPHVIVAFPASPSAPSFPLTLACPGQCIHVSLRRWMSNIDTRQSRNE